MSSPEANRSKSKREAFQQLLKRVSVLIGSCLFEWVRPSWSWAVTTEGLGQQAAPHCLFKLERRGSITRASRILLLRRQLGPQLEAAIPQILKVLPRVAVAVVVIPTAAAAIQGQ